MAFVMEEFHVKRRTSVLIVFLGLWLLGGLCSLSLGVLSEWKIFGKTIFDLFDYISANVLMLIGGLIVVIFVGWKLSKQDMSDELTNGGTLHVPDWLINFLSFLLRYVAPTAIIIIMVSQMLA